MAYPEELLKSAQSQICKKTHKAVILKAACMHVDFYKTVILPSLFCCAEMLAIE